MELARTFSARIQEDESLFTRANIITKNYEIILKVFDNPGLFDAAYFCCKRVEDTISGGAVFRLYDNIGDTLDKMVDNDVLIYFSNLGLYGLYYIEGYTGLIKTIETDMMKRNKDLYESGKLKTLKKPEIYQVVMSGKKQKFVFACKDAQHFEAFERCAEKCFGKRVIFRSGNEITLDFDVESTKDILATFSTLTDFIEATSKDFSDFMKKINTHTYCGIEYRKYSCSSAIDFWSNNKPANWLAFTHTVNINTVNNINSNNTNSNNTTNTHSNNTNSNSNNTKTIITKNNQHTDWIVKNPPKSDESTKEYYERFQLSNKSDTSNCIFGKSVKAAKYDVVKKGGKRIYVYKS